MEIPYVFSNVSISASSGSTTALKAAASGKFNRLHSLFGSLTDAGTVQIKSGAVALTGVMEFLADTPINIRFVPTMEGSLGTSVGAALNLTVSEKFNGYAVVSQSTF